MKRCKRLAALFVVVVLLCPMTNTVSTEAKTAAEARQRKSELQSQKKQAKANIAKYQASIENLFDNIQALDNKLDKLGRRVNKLTDKLNNKRADLKQTRTDLAAAKKREKSQYENMKTRIKYMYENGNDTYMTALFAAESFSDVMNQKEYVDQVAEYDATMYQRYKETRIQIQENEKKLEKEVKQVKALTEQVKAERSTVQQTMKRKTDKMERYQNHVAKNEALIHSYNKSIKAEERAIKAAEKAAKAAAQNSSGGGSLPESTSGNSTYTGGQFLWPCPASTTITSPFGWRVHPVNGGRRLHAGVDIATPTGSSVLAAEAGTVIVSQYSSSAGNYIMIDHGGGLSTVYMHNSSLLVSVGEKVKRGQTIAYSGSTGWSTGPHLHFSVRVNGEYVNPMPYVQ